MYGMKTISEMFPNEPNIKDRLDEVGIRIPDNFRFSDINIVIGKNGAGKTRFLDTLKALYRSNKGKSRVELLYGYFPGLSDRLLQRDVGLPEHELREFPSQPEVSFDDFFKEIETQSKDFLTRLPEYHSLRQKETTDKILGSINDFFFPITGKKLIMPLKEHPPIVTHDASIIITPMPQKFARLELDGEKADLLTAMERFSPGERLLLYIAIFFALKRSSVQERIIILDEPETHLHPQALLTFIRTLKEQFPHTTVWIATHSLFLLPEFRFENIVYMEDGEIVSRGSKLYETVLTALLGQNNEKTCQFFSSLPHWQYSEFITECFAHPEVVDTINSKDEQVQLFLKALQEQQIRRVLDCGGGSGRLGLSLEASNVFLDAYEIYDAYPSYSGDKFPVYTRLEDIPDTYDCVVMMNFLHEVKPDEWPELFNKIYNLLKSGGNLLFVEVAALTNGEWPNETGYMLLGRSELSALFGINNNLSEIRIRDNQKSVGILIPRQSLKKVTVKTVSAAINGLEKRTYAELKQIRSEAANWKKDKSGKQFNARRYAFLSQQYINAKLFNGSVHPVSSPPQQLNPMISNEKLAQMLKLANKLIVDDSSVDSELSGSTRSIFRATVKFYNKNGRITDVQRRRCAESVQLMKARGAENQTVEAFSEILLLL